MLQICLATLSGGYLLAFCSRLPPDFLSVPFFALAAVCAFLRRARLIGWMLLGFCWTWQSGAGVLDDRLSQHLENTQLELTGTVATFPEARGQALRFQLRTGGMGGMPRLIRLTWYDPPKQPRLGETWRLQVKLRRPRGFTNPVLFDYERWLFQQRIGATGYVVAHPENDRIREVPISKIAILRTHFAKRIFAVKGDNAASAVLAAIAIGARHRIERREWDQFASTGTSHLMAISGLHIGLVAGGVFCLAWATFGGICRWSNVRDLAAVASLVAASAYATLSGFAVPARRALLMLAIVATVALLRRQCRSEQVVALAAFALFIGDPLSIYSPGFQLSFAAVAIILFTSRQRDLAVFVNRRRGQRAFSAFRQLHSLQLHLLLGLLPLAVAIFGRVSWVAPAVNLLVLPVFSFLAVPATLTGLLLDGPLQPIGDCLLLIAWHSVNIVLALIAGIAEWPQTRVDVATSGRLLLPAALLCLVWTIFPPGWPGRRLAWVAALFVMLYQPAPIQNGCVALTVLDVGQGLAAVLRTSRRTLIYDTGPSFRSGGNAGTLVLLPYLKALGIRHVDLLIVSHADQDHAGGAAALVASIDVRQILAGEPVPGVSAPQLRCRSGQVWRWDGVNFAVRHPGTALRPAGNDASCVLEVSVGRFRMLLTGDIEAAAERRLVASESLSPQDLVLVPHHGSRTSSSNDFVQRLLPQVAVVSSGYRNRWGLPKREVVARWEKAGATVVNTATSGAIDFRVCAASGLTRTAVYRPAPRRFWQDAGDPEDVGHSLRENF